MNTAALYFVFPGDLDTPTGGYHYDRRLIGQLRDLGLACQVVALPDTFPHPDERTVEVTRQTFAQLPDGAVVIIDGLAFGALDRLARAEAKRLRLIALCHHPLALETGLDSAQAEAFRRSERLALAAARAVIVTSAHTGRILSRDFGVPAHRIVTAPPGTDRVPFAPADGEPPTLLAVASITRRKAHDVLIDALAPLASLPWQARFVGADHFDPRWTAALHERVNQRGLTGRIVFTGAVDDLAREYQGADVFVLPSRYEGYGMVFAEALAAGLPVVAARGGAVPDVVPDSAGLLVEPDDTTALTRALGCIMTDRELRRRLQRGARQAAADLPTWDHSARRVAGLIEEVLRS